jgi:hypothetical protein
VKECQTIVCIYWDAGVLEFPPIGALELDTFKPKGLSSKVLDVYFEKHLVPFEFVQEGGGGTGNVDFGSNREGVGDLDQVSLGY